MIWHYAEGNQQRGPVTEEEFDRLIQSGVIKPSTLVWRQGMEQWQPLSVVRPPAVNPGQPPPIAPMGIAPEAAAAPGFIASEAEVRSRDYDLDVSACFSRSYEMLKANPGSIIGASVLVYLCILGISSVPYLGPLAGLVLTGPLMGGLWHYYIAELRRRAPKPSEAFSGFGPRFLDLFLGHAVPTILAALVMLPMIALAVGMVVLMSGGPGKLGGGDEAMTALMLVGIIFGVLLGLISIAAAVYLQTSWMFTLPLVMDKGMAFWPAMSLSRAVVGKHVWLLLLLTILAGLLATAGMLLCCVGVFFTGPIAFGAVAMAYEKLLGDLAPVERTQPPA